HRLTPLSETVRKHLAATAQRELDTLRAELDTRLSALEAALTQPDPNRSLEDLVLDLARVATAEAVSSSQRKTLEVQVQGEERAPPFRAPRGAREPKTAISQSLRIELEQARKMLDAERAAHAGLRAESDDDRKLLEEGRAAAAASRRQLQELEH